MKDAVALINGTTGETLTIRQLLQYSVNLATSLTSLGIGNGDVVAIGSEKRITYLPTVLSVLFTGATCTPYGLDSGKAILRQKLSVAKPTHLICSKLFWERHEEVLNSCGSIKSYISFDCVQQNALTIKDLVAKDIDIERYEPVRVLGQVDTTFILYSSGTTGAPKGIRLTHLNSIMSSLPDNYKDEWNIQTAYILGEWNFNYDTFMTFKLLYAGKKVVYIDDVTILNILQCIEKYQINILMVLPYQLNLIIKAEALERFNLETLTIIYSRSTLLHKNTIEQVKQRLPKLQHILQGYGMTECGEPTSEIRAVKGPRPGSVGMAAPGITIKIVDLKNDIKLGPNQSGEIRVRGPMLMKEYIGLDPSIYLDEEGFLKTGDVGYYDDDKLPKLQHILQGYGMTECGEPTSEIRAVKGPRPGSVGMAAPGITIKIVDLKNDIKLGPNQSGEIRVRGPMLMKEYIGLDPSIYLDEEGFLKTGDVGYYDDDKYLYIVERMKYLINYQGNKIAPLQLENLLEMHPNVLEASVIGKPDPDDGEIPMAFVVKRLESEVTEEELLDYLASEVPKYMQLKGGVKFIDKLPRSPRGKILRRHLGEMLNQFP